MLFLAIVAATFRMAQGQDGSAQLQQVETLRQELADLHLDSSKQAQADSLQQLISEMTNLANDIAKIQKDSQAAKDKLGGLKKQFEDDAAELNQLNSKLEPIKEELENDGRELSRDIDNHNNRPHEFTPEQGAASAAYDNEKRRLDERTQELEQRRNEYDNGADRQRGLALVDETKDLQRQAAEIVRQVQDPGEDILSFNQDLAKVQAIFAGLNFETKVRPKTLGGDAMQNLLHIQDNLTSRDPDRNRKPGYDGEEVYSAKPVDALAQNAGYLAATSQESAAEQQISSLKRKLFQTTNASQAETIFKQITSLQSTAVARNYEQKVLQGAMTVGTIAVPVHLDTLHLPPPGSP